MSSVNGNYPDFFQTSGSFFVFVNNSLLAIVAIQVDGTVGLKEWIIPQDKIFFDLFEEQARTVQIGAEQLVSIIGDFTDIRNKCHKMKEIEHKGDEITHTMYELLNKSFITPIEPEEISRLMSGLDDILDLIDGVSHQMHLYNIEATDDYMKELGSIILASTEELATTMPYLRNVKKNVHAIETACIEINRLENLADEVLGQATKELFCGTDAIAIIKMKDIYENLETATDRCEDVANVLSDIAIRHS